MKTSTLIILIVLVLAGIFAFNHYRGRSLGDHVDDALDARPAEGLRDAVENVVK
ncbi:MAG: hypothetical protein IPK22_27430 [Verrucomicrobiaceae bacterium]|nr:hypothetical protein [Verrucomicrobiaceae bacterium]